MIVQAQLSLARHLGQMTENKIAHLALAGFFHCMAPLRLCASALVMGKADRCFVAFPYCVQSSLSRLAAYQAELRKDVTLTRGSMQQIPRVRCYWKRILWANHMRPCGHALCGSLGYKHG